MIYNIKISNGDRSDVIDYILSKKNNGEFKVIDFGGSFCGWSAPYIDALVDFVDPISTNPSIRHFKIDITHPDSYNELLEYVSKNGMFDFCICTHTLEDIMNPVFVCEQISKISKEGYIAFPSKFRELSRIEGNYRGFIHHRYIFKVKNNNQIIAYPKINYIENDIFDKVSNSSESMKDLNFYWKDSIDMVYLNNNFLGPSVYHVMNMYNDLLSLK
jgi:hypothetical protein